jgi:hypothetical protein
MYIRSAYVGVIMNNSHTWLTHETLSLYRAVNASLLNYKNQSVYVIEGKSHCLFQDKYNTVHINIVSAEYTPYRTFEC